MRTLTSLLSGSFIGKMSGIRYEANVGKPLTEMTKGDFDGVIGVYFDSLEVEPEAPIEVVKAEPKKSKPKQSKPRR